MSSLNSTFHPLLAWCLLAYYAIFFALGFVWRSWAVYRSTGINPLVLPRDDSAQGYIGRAFKWVLALLGLDLVLAALGTHPWPNALWQAPDWLQLVAWAGLAIALVWVAWAQHQMGAAWRIGIDEQHATGLVSTGLFGVSRNPIFLAMRCAMACTLVLQPRASMLAWCVAAEILMQIQVRLEEAHLLAQHGQRYRQYCQQVRRWI